MKARSGHIVLDKNYMYKDIADVFRGMFRTFLDETGIVDEGSLIESSNLRDLGRNTKPEGWNREGPWRLIFPIRDDGVIEMYVLHSSPSSDVGRITDTLSTFLRKKGFAHEVVWNRLRLYAAEDAQAAESAAWCKDIYIEWKAQCAKGPDKCGYRQGLPRSFKPLFEETLLAEAREYCLQCQKSQWPVVGEQARAHVLGRLRRYERSST